MDFAKKTARFKRSKNPKIYLLQIVAVITGLMVISAAGFYFYKRTSLETNFIASGTSRIKSWVADRKSNFQQGVVKVKQQIAVKKSTEEPQIHFDFYNTLPNAESATPSPELSPEPIHEVVAQPKKEPLKAVAVHALFTSPEELERELSEQIKQTRKSQKREKT